MKKVECYDISQRSDVFREYKGTPTLCARMGTGGNNVPIVLSEKGTDRAVSVDRTGPLKTTTIPTLFYGCVRRLTPVECERLQGFPDEYTQIPYREKPAETCPDAPRYKAIGNSWPVPVIRWIGKRIDKVLRGESL